MTFNKEIERTLDFGYLYHGSDTITLLHVDYNISISMLGICFHVDYTLASLFFVEDLFFKVFFSLTTIHS